jgi:hypothetical protein
VISVLVPFLVSLGAAIAIAAGVLALGHRQLDCRRLREGRLHVLRNEIPRGGRCRVVTDIQRRGKAFGFRTVELTERDFLQESDAYLAGPDDILVVAASGSVSLEPFWHSGATVP